MIEAGQEVTLVWGEKATYISSDDEGSHVLFTLDKGLVLVSEFMIKEFADDSTA